ncbi:MAG TPA: hypothetical protein VGM60_23940 [Pseudonocardia sp.]|uniref:hypothetical protein n=1 Tax=Pseudonocardia sp. TaxID=60912 RepID=UPI002F42DD3F
MLVDGNPVLDNLDEPEGGAVSTTTPVLPPTQPVLPRITLTGDEERADTATDQ